jgi:hypothetical protein
VSGPPEIERQVVAAADRYREVAASHDAAGLPESGRHAAAKAVGRSLQLLSFVLKRAVDDGVSVERLSELTGLDPEPVRELLERPPAPDLMARAADAGAESVGRAEASSDASQRLHMLTLAILADIDDERWSPAAADLDDLHDRLESAWSAWRQALGGPDQ